jgi:hypothetical protein
MIPTSLKYNMRGSIEQPYVQAGTSYIALLTTFNIRMVFAVAYVSIDTSSDARECLARDDIALTHASWCRDYGQV